MLTAWKRIYYELDAMYRQGGSITKVALADTNTVVVHDDAGAFQIGQTVRIWDYDANRDHAYVITNIRERNGGERELTLNNPLPFKIVPRGRETYVGIEMGTPEQFLFLPKTDKLSDTFDDVFIEVIGLPGGAQRLPHVERLREGQLPAFSKFFFANHDKTNYFHLVGADQTAVRRDELSGLGKTDSRFNSWRQTASCHREKRPALPELA